MLPEVLTWGTEQEYPFEYGKYYRNKSMVFCLQRRFSEAIELATRAAELQKRDTGIGPRYLYYRRDLAGVMLQSGETCKSR